MTQRILALDIADNMVRAALAERNWNSIEVIGVFEQERAPNEADTSAALTRLLRKSGKPDIVISALPGEVVAKRLLELPFNDRRKLRQVVPFALEEHLPFPVDDAAISFVPVGRDGTNTLVIAAFARKDDLRRHLDLLAKAELDPKTVTLSTLALAQMLARGRNGQRRPHLLLDIDHASTSMVLLDSEGIPRAIRTIGTGVGPGANGNPIPGPAASAIRGAIRQTLLAHGSDLEEPDLILSGPAAGATTIRSQLAQALSLPVRSIGEFDYPAPLTAARREPLRFATCLAMLLSEAPDNPAELLNFRQGEFAFQGRTGDFTHLYVSGILGLAALCFALIHLGLGISSGLHRLSVLNREMAAVAAPVLGSVPASDVRTKLESGVADMQRRLRMMGGGSFGGSPLDTLVVFSRVLPPRLPAEVEDLVIDDSGLKIQGHADSFATVDQVKNALDRSGYFGNIKVDHAAAGGSDNKVDFRVSASIKDSLGASNKPGGAN